MKILKVLPIIFIFSCSSFKTSNIAPGYIETYKAIKQALIGYEETGLSRELIDDIPFASMTLQIGKGPTGLMILESIKDNEYTWVSADKVYIVFRNGRVIQTEGLNNNLKSVIYPNINFKKIINEGYSKFKAYYSYTDPVLNNLELEVVYTVKGKEEIEILGRQYSLMLVNERISNRLLGWNFINSYWVDVQGFVMKSNQIINPKLPKFSFQITKKPSK